jgi:hypothetical protein
MPITHERTMNDIFIHPSLHPCRTGWENEKTNSGVSCSLQQARMRRRRVWMRIRFLFIHPNLCNSITVSKRPAGWRMPITDEPTMNHPFHTSIYPSISNGMWKRMVLWIHISSGKCQTRRCCFPSVFLFFFIEFCGMRIVQSRRGSVLFSLQKKISFYSTED